MASVEVTPATTCMEILAHDPRTHTTWVRLPRELWREIDGGCACDVCKASGGVGYWDTMAIPRKGHTWVLHMPLETVATFIEYLKSPKRKPGRAFTRL